MERDSIVMYNGEHYRILEIAINTAYLDNGELDIRPCALLTKLEPAIFSPRFRAFWCPIEKIVELISSMDYRSSDWMLGVVRGHYNAD